MTLLAALIALLVLLEAASMRYALKGLTYDIHPARSTVEPGESLELVSTVQNKSALPKTFLKISEYMPSGASPADGDGEGFSSLSSEDGGRGFVPRSESDRVSSRVDNLTLSPRIVSSMFIMPGQKLTRSVNVKFASRGRYLLRGGTLSSGDFLGLTTRNMDVDIYKEIVVIPRRAEGDDVSRLMGGFLGDMSVRRFIHEDPVLTVGFREYTGREPMKSIAWQRSAAGEELLVRNNDHTAEPTATVALNIEAGRIGGERGRALIERCFSITRTVCETLDEKRIQYRFFTNARATGAEGIWQESVDGMGGGHTLAVLEGLGRASYYPAESFRRTLGRAARKAEAGRSHIIITPYMDEKYAPGIARIRTVTGCDVHIISAQDSDAAESGVGAQ